MAIAANNVDTFTKQSREQKPAQHKKPNFVADKGARRAAALNRKRVRDARHGHLDENIEDDDIVDVNANTVYDADDMFGGMVGGWNHENVAVYLADLYADSQSATTKQQIENVANTLEVEGRSVWHRFVDELNARHCSLYDGSELEDDLYFRNTFPDTDFEDMPD